MARPEDLPRVEDARRVERAFDRAHQIELDRALVADELVALLLADAVLGADAAAVSGDQVVDDAVGARRMGEEGSAATPSGAARL